MVQRHSTSVSKVLLRGVGLVTAIAAASASVLASGVGATTVQRPMGRYTGVRQTPIQHVVFLLKENRSFDNYFGKYCAIYYPTGGCDGATQGTMSTGQEIFGKNCSQSYGSCIASNSMTAVSISGSSSRRSRSTWPVTGRSRTTRPSGRRSIT